MDVGVGNLKLVFRLFRCFSDSSDHAESYTIHKYTDLRVHIPHTQTLTQAGEAETEGDRDSKEMEIESERDNKETKKAVSLVLQARWPLSFLKAQN